MWRAGGWPLIMEEDEWDQKIYKWQNVDDYYARLTGLNSFHDVHASTNYWIHKGLNLFVSTYIICESKRHYFYKVTMVKSNVI